MPTVLKERCPQDHPCPCVRMCPVDAVLQTGFGAPEIDKQKCIECGVCENFCPYRAIIPSSDDSRDRASQRV